MLSNYENSHKKQPDAEEASEKDLGIDSESGQCPAAARGPESAARAGAETFDPGRRYVGGRVRRYGHRSADRRAHMRRAVQQ